MVDNAPIPFEIAKLQAAQTLERMIAGKLLEGKDGKDSALLQNVSVRVATRLSYAENEPDKEVVRLELSGPDVAERLVASRELLEKILQDLPGLKTHIKFGNDDQEANNTRATLAELIDKGADVPKELLKWAGFSHENNESNKYWESAKHTSCTQVDANGVEVHINLPDHLPEGITMDAIKENLESRKEALLSKLAERIAKYKGVKGNKEEEANIRAGLEALEFEVHSSGERVSGEETKTGNLSISFRSPEQKAAKELHDKERPLEPIEANPELERSNVLQSIKPQELSKAMGRVILDGGDVNMNITMAIIGGKDVYRLLEKQLAKLKTQKPETAEKVDEVLASTLFSDRDALLNKHAQHETKLPLAYVGYPAGDNVAAENKIIVDIPLPKDEAGKFIREVAAMGGNQAMDFSQFASIDNVQLVGIHSQIPSMHQQLQQMVAPFVGRQVDAPDMDSFAQNIVNLIEQAHAQVTEAKQVLAGVEMPQQTVQPAALAQNINAAVHAAKQEEQSEPLTPTPNVVPSSIAMNQSPAIDFNQPNWAQKLAALTGKPASGYGMGA